MSITEEQVKLLKGLTETEAQERIKKDGYNELPASKKRSILKIALGVLKEPMFILLVACGVIYLIIGEPNDAIMLLGFVFVMMGITIYQEGKTENALEALKDLSSPRALVIRDGEKKRIAGREVAREDIMILNEGDRVPADGIILWGINLTVDESLLTGEAVPVRKAPVEGEDREIITGRPGGDDLPFIFSGTMIVQGQGVALVKTTGIKTEIGKIGKTLQEVTEEETPLQKETGKVVRIIFVAALILCIIVFAAYGLYNRDWLKGFLSGVTLAMAMLPEEFPVVLTVFLALGAWRISAKQVLTRRVSAVETLGASTILCTDKTGTLTQNKMSIKKIYANGKFYDTKTNGMLSLPEDFHELIEFGILASKKDTL